MTLLRLVGIISLRNTDFSQFTINLGLVGVMQYYFLGYVQGCSSD